MTIITTMSSLPFGKPGCAVQTEHASDGKHWTVYSDSRFLLLSSMNDHQRLAFWRRRRHLQVYLSMRQPRRQSARCAEALAADEEVRRLLAALLVEQVRPDQVHPDRVDAGA